MPHGTAFWTCCLQVRPVDVPSKEAHMWAVVKRSIVIGAGCLAVASGTAYAGYTNVLEVKVPFSFVVNGQTLPAGQYSVMREDDASAVMILRGEHGNNASAILNTRPASDNGPGGNQPALEFKKVEKEYQLSNVWTPDGMARKVVPE